eukprot:COSAG01_NODE_5254_length_4380_cov_3.719823_2_plen_221_part_00
MIKDGDIDKEFFTQVHVMMEQLGKTGRKLFEDMVKKMGQSKVLEEEIEYHEEQVKLKQVQLNQAQQSDEVEGLTIEEELAAAAGAGGEAYNVEDLEAALAGLMAGGLKGGGPALIQLIIELEAACKDDLDFDLFGNDEDDDAAGAAEVAAINQRLRVLEIQAKALAAEPSLAEERRLREAAEFKVLQLHEEMRRVADHFDPLHRRAHCRGIARWEGGGGI